MTLKQREYFVKRIGAIAQDAIERKQATTYLTPDREEEHRKKLIPIDTDSMMNLMRNKMKDALLFSKYSYKMFNIGKEECYYNFPEVMDDIEHKAAKFQSDKDTWIREVRAERDSLCDNIILSSDAESSLEKIRIFESKLSIVE
jgi:hypothetical protein